MIMLPIHEIVPSLYVDPGSGTLLWQAICAIVAGALFSLRNSLKTSKKAPIEILPSVKNESV